ncbi:hypothetical protein [Emergencia timonensis]|uniref:hypothetical protein n=1 Tax=Emergencia timonensis TaxID=1776384 RepID=UPI003995DE15
MKKTIYLIKKETLDGQGEKFIEVTGKEFYQRISSPEGAEVYFIRLTDDIAYESDEIFIEVSQDEYKRWRKEYDADRYLASTGNELVIISLDGRELRMSQALLCGITDGDNPETSLIRKDDYGRLKNALMQLTPEERWLIGRLYLNEILCTEREVAEELHITQQAVSKKKKKISKR